MKIKKYINDAQSSGVASKLLSYSAMAAAFVASGPNANAQCAGETAVPGTPALLDIDGDGTDDVQIFGGSFFTTFATGSYTVPQGTIPVGTVPFFSAMATASIPQTVLATGVALYYGCYVVSAGYGPFAVAGPTVSVGPATATAMATVSAMVSYTNVFASVAYGTFASFNYCFVTALGSNQIVGLSATGTGVCGVIDSAPGVAGVGTSSFVGSNYSVITAYYAVVGGGVRYDLPTTTATAMATASTILSGVTCTTSTASVFSGYFAAGPQLTFTTGATASIPPQPDVTYAGPYLLAGPYSGSSVVATGGINLITAVAVQFESGGETYNGWVTLSCNGDGTITCTGSGYQQCSIESALATSGDAADACINVGEATNSNAACALPCVIETSVDTMCDDNGTPDDGSDDMITVTITVTDTGGGGTTWSDDQGNTGIAYGTPMMYPAMPAGGMLTVVITDDGDAACMETVEVVLEDCAVVENIPTVGEWGLIILGLMMSITAIVGIRQRREEEVVA